MPDPKGPPLNVPDPVGYDFTDRTVLVTGAGSGIGLDIASILLAAGATVIGFDVEPGKVPAGASVFTVDVSDERQVADAMADVIRRHGPVDTLFNNAGIGSTTSVVDCEPEEWDRVFAVNVRGTYLCTRLVLPAMLERRSGVIVNTASAAGLIGLPDRAAYCASKGAVIALTRQIAVQWAAHGIRCNCICPGTVDSPWVQRLLDHASDPVARRSELVARQPMGRLGTSREVALAAVYLASDAAAFITGSELVIDGGIIAG
jgi:2-keto-3-deoxy-L-fuconate dehydrogenase